MHGSLGLRSISPWELPPSLRPDQDQSGPPAKRQPASAMVGPGQNPHQWRGSVGEAGTSPRSFGDTIRNKGLSLFRCAGKGGSLGVGDFTRPGQWPRVTRSAHCQEGRATEWHRGRTYRLQSTEEDQVGEWS